VVGLTWDPIWRSPLTRTDTKMCVWSHCNGWPTQKKWWFHCDGWPTRVEKMMVSLWWVTYPEKKKWSHCDGWLTQVEDDGLIMMGDLPKWKSGKWSHCYGWPTQMKDERWSHYNGWPTQMIECDLPGKKTRLEKSWFLTG